MPPAEAGAKIPCPTPHALQIELDALATVLEPDEREDTWEKFERALIRFAAITRGGGYKHLELYVRGVGNKGVGLRIVDCMLSDRGRLSGVSTDLLQAFAPRLASHFQPLIHLYLPPLVRLLARPNKVYLKRAEKCLQTIISNCHLPNILIHLRNGLDDKSDACRRSSAVGVERAMLEWEHSIWSEKGLDTLELCIRKIATDRDADVRKTGKRVWAHFQEIWPERVDDFSNPLTPTIRRYLDIPQVDGLPAKPKTRAAARPIQATLRAAASTHEPPTASTASCTARNDAHAGPSRRTRLARVRSNTTDDEEHHPPARAPITGLGRATRTVSATQPLSKQTSASSLHDKHEVSRQALLSKPARTLPPSSFRDDAARRQPVHRARSQELRRPHSTEPEDRRGPLDESLGSSRSSSTQRTQPPSPRRAKRTASAQDSSESLPSLASSSAAPAPIPPPVGRVKARVSDFERLVGENTPPARPPVRAEVQAVAAIPLPPSPTLRPVVKDEPSSQKQQQAEPQKTQPLPMESPSLSSLLRKTDVGEADMTLLDLSLANVSVAQSPAPPRPSSTSSLSSTPKPAVSSLIQKFSPNQTHTPLRRASMDNPGSATPTAKALRRISPLPRRSMSANPMDDSSPPRLGTKRKGSDPEISFPEELRTAEREKPTGPRFSQPLIAFGDSPARGDTSFAFGGLASVSSYGKMGMRRESTLQDLMSLATPSVFEALATPAKAQARVQPGALAEEDESETQDPDVTVSLVSGTTASTPLTWSTSSGPVEDLLDMDETAILTGPPVELMPEHVSPVARQPEPFATSGDTAAANDDSVSEGDTIRESKVALEIEAETELEEDPQAVAAPPSEGSEPVKETQFDDYHTESEPAIALEDAAEDDSEEEAEVTVLAVEPPAPSAAPASPEAKPAAQPAAPPLPRSVSAPVPETMRAGAEPETSLLGSISEGASPEQPEPRVAEAPVETKTAQAKPGRLQTSQRSAPGPRRPANAPIRPATRTVSHPVEKKSFRPVSRLLGDKGAPAPAKLATRNVSDKEPEKRSTATLSASQKRSASAMTKGSASASSTVSKGTAAATSTAGDAGGLSASTRSTESSTQSASSNNRKPSGQATRNTASSLFKPTAATAARTAAAASAKAEAKPPSRPGTAMSNPSANATRPARPGTAMGNASNSAAGAPRARTAPASGGGLFASTAASRARNAEAALPPSKRQRVKLKAPMESFRPGRSANKNKASVLGTSSAGAAAKRPVRAVTRRDGAASKAETFPLPGPGLSMSQNDALRPETAAEKGSERSVRSSPAEIVATPQPPVSPPSKKSTQCGATSASPVSTKSKSSSLAIPVPSNAPSQDDFLTRTPTSTSPLASAAEHLTPNSTRTSRSRDSGSSPGSKIVPTLPKALDPVLTAVHGADVLHRTPSKKGGESPAILHSRRISGIPPSLKKMLDAQKAERGSPDGSLPEDADDENLVVIRSDVSTPSGKSAAILARFSDRGVLQDAN